MHPPMCSPPMKICGMVFCTGAIGEHRANPAAEVVLLVLDRIEIDAAIGDAEPRKQLAHRPAELAPLEREHHHRLFVDEVRHQARRVGVDRDRLLDAGHAVAPGGGASKRHSGVERDSASSSAVIASPMSSNSGVDR